MTAELLLDNSAWARLNHPLLFQRRADEIADALEEGRIATCLPFLLEAGYSARNSHDHGELIEQLLALPRMQIDEEIERLAIDAQAQLARVGHYRLPPVDLIVAATAERHELGILHYDGDYDLLREKTNLRFNSVWLAPRGSL
jgi:predicted nucleic acid-binding protein